MLLELIKAVVFLVDSIENSPILPFYCVLLTAKKKKKNRMRKWQVLGYQSDHFQIGLRSLYQFGRGRQSKRS